MNKAKDGTGNLPFEILLKLGRCRKQLLDGGFLLGRPLLLLPTVQRNLGRILGPGQPDRVEQLVQIALLARESIVSALDVTPAWQNGAKRGTPEGVRIMVTRVRSAKGQFAVYQPNIPPPPTGSFLYRSTGNNAVSLSLSVSFDMLSHMPHGNATCGAATEHF